MQRAGPRLLAATGASWRRASPTACSLLARALSSSSSSSASAAASSAQQQQQHQQRHARRSTAWARLLGAAGLAAAAGAAAAAGGGGMMTALADAPHKQPAAAQQQLPEYTADEVAKHRTLAERVWVTYKDGVYDVTDFIAQHPGGAGKIMLAGAWHAVRLTSPRFMHGRFD
jgi:cytochrome b involved in lipid metabolism